MKKRILILLSLFTIVLSLSACGNNQQKIENSMEKRIETTVKNKDNSLNKAKQDLEKQMQNLEKEVSNREKEKVILNNKDLIVVYNDNFRTANILVDKEMFNNFNVFSVKIKKNINENDIVISSDNYKCRSIINKDNKEYIEIECKKKEGKLGKFEEVGNKIYLFSITSKNEKDVKLYKSILLYK